MGKRWLPLEANPDVMNEFCSRLGMDISKVSCVDVFGLDEELLCMVPQPVLALLMLFPITDASEAAQREEEARVADQGQIVSEKLYYMKQTIGNACGTIGLLHAIGNNRDTIPLKEGSFLSSFFSCTQGLDPQQRGQFLENPPENAPDIEDAHKDAAEQGATAPPSADEDVNLHFIAFVCKEGHLYELDGRKARPINHGPSSEATLLSDAVAVVRQFVARLRRTHA